MQTVLLEEDSSPMTEHPIDLQMLSRIDSEQKATASRVEDVDKRLQGLACEVSEIKGSIKPPAETPWWLRFIIAPVCVAAILATAAAVIHLEIQVNAIGKNVGGVQISLAKQTLTTYAALSPSEFTTALPDLHSSIAAARTEKVKVPPKVINDLAQRLTVLDTGTPGFWPAAAEVISYRSFDTISWPRPKNLPTCTDYLPAPNTISILSPTEARINPSVYENCRVVLDSPEQDAKLNKLIQGRLTAVVFRHCVIVYRGGPIDLVIAIDKRNVPYQHSTATGTVNVKVDHTIEFQECLFDIILQNQPPPKGQELTQFLLASNTGTISVPLTMPN